MLCLQRSICSGTVWLLPLHPIFSCVDEVLKLNGDYQGWKNCLYPRKGVKFSTTPSVLSCTKKVNFHPIAKISLQILKLLWKEPSSFPTFPILGGYSFVTEEAVFLYCGNFSVLNIILNCCFKFNLQCSVVWTEHFVVNFGRYL